jgi:hypothetical protein
MKTFSEYIRQSTLSNNPNLLNETLTYSISHDKFSDKMEDLLRNDKSIADYSVEPETDGVKVDITFNKKDKEFLSKLNSLLNLANYYTSFYITDGKLVKYGLSLASFFNMKSSITFCFNKRYDFSDSGIKSKLYHITDSDLEDKIIKQGLVPKSKRMIDNHPERIYLFDSKRNVRYFIEQKQNELKRNGENFKPMVLQIDVPLVDKLKLYVDPKYYGASAFYTYDNISPVAISVVTNEFIID